MWSGSPPHPSPAQCPAPNPQRRAEARGAPTNTALSIFSPGPFSGLPIWRCLSLPSPGSRLPFILPRGEDNFSLSLGWKRVCVVCGADGACAGWGRAWEDSWVSGVAPRAGAGERRKRAGGDLRPGLDKQGGKGQETGGRSHRPGVDASTGAPKAWPFSVRASQPPELVREGADLGQGGLSNVRVSSPPFLPVTRIPDASEFSASLTWGNPCHGPVG